MLDSLAPRRVKEAFEGRIGFAAVVYEIKMAWMPRQYL